MPERGEDKYMEGRGVTLKLSVREALRLRMRAQRLSGERPGDVVAALAAVTAIQAQDTQASRLALRARGEGFDAASVRRACNETRSIVRTWTLRGTLHMTPTEDVRWLVTLLGPRNTAGDRGRRRQLGLDDETCERALRVIRSILERDLALTRAELVTRLGEHGITLDLATQAPAHLIFYAATNGLICRGPDRDDDEPTYALLDRWVPPIAEETRSSGFGELARRYFSAYGPATAADFAAWAGIGLTEANAGIRDLAGELQEALIGEERAWMLASVEPHSIASDAPCLRLLPTFDTYLLGYRARDRALDPAFSKRVNAGGGWIHPTVALDGKIIGVWRAATRGKALRIQIQPFEPLESWLTPLIEAEAADIGRFLRCEASAEIAEV